MLVSHFDKRRSRALTVKVNIGIWIALQTFQNDGNFETAYQEVDQLIEQTEKFMTYNRKYFSLEDQIKQYP